MPPANSLIVSRNQQRQIKLAGPSPAGGGGGGRYLLSGACSQISTKWLTHSEVAALVRVGVEVRGRRASWGSWESLEPLMSGSRVLPVVTR